MWPKRTRAILRGQEVSKFGVLSIGTLVVGSESLYNVLHVLLVDGQVNSTAFLIDNFRHAIVIISEGDKNGFVAKVLQFLIHPKRPIILIAFLTLAALATRHLYRLVTRGERVNVSVAYG